jgi:hypothetical protein
MKASMGKEEVKAHKFKKVTESSSDDLHEDATTLIKSFKKLLEEVTYFKKGKKRACCVWQDWPFHSRLPKQERSRRQEGIQDGQV